VRDTSSNGPATAPRHRRVAVRSAPVTFRYSRGDIDVAGDACDKLVRRLRHLAHAQTIIAKVDAATPSVPVELTATEKGFLVIAVKAWMEDTGRDRVPITIIRLRETLLGDLFYPTEDADGPTAQPEPESAVENTDSTPVAPTAEDGNRASLLRLRDAIATALAALEGAAIEIEAALARAQEAENRPT
jgi:hypothetical protein